MSSSSEVPEVPAVPFYPHLSRNIFAVPITDMIGLSSRGEGEGEGEGRRRADSPTRRDGSRYGER
jgi:hypothetical protein